MNCPTCQTVLADGSPFCSTCGANLTGRQQFGQPQMYGTYQQQQMEMPARTSGLAIAGFILSLLSCSLLGLILSVVGYNECKRSLGTVKGEGLALAGIIISIVWLVVGILYFATESLSHSHY